MARIATLVTHHHLTQFKIRDLLARMMEVDFSVGAISQAHGLVSDALAEPGAQARLYVTIAPLMHLDETRHLLESGGNWAWGAVTPKVVVYSLLPPRARCVAYSLIGEKPEGFSAYETCKRQGRDLWDFLHHAVVAKIDKSTPPSLLPDLISSG